MKNLIQKTIFIHTFLLLIAITLKAQHPSDSLQTVEEALKLISYPAPNFQSPLVADPKSLADMGFEQVYTSQPIKFRMRDGAKIHAQKYAFSSPKTVILIHGVLSSSYLFNKTAGLLRKSLEAEVIAIDLRGHGQSGGKAGDVANSNQYAEDLDDIIASIRVQKPDQKIILAGHSMGGGVILKHAETFPTTSIHGYVLFAPNLGGNSPTTPQEIDPSNNFVKTHVVRGLGLYMLNQFNLYQYDSMKVVLYNLPEQMPIRSYSYRSMKASAPQYYWKSLEAIQKPLLILVGSEDEAFIAAEYPPIIKAYSQGEVYIVEGTNHNGIRHHEKAMEKIHQWAIQHSILQK